MRRIRIRIKCFCGYLIDRIIYGRTTITCPRCGQRFRV